MINKYVVIDLETTGSSPKRGDKILQFAAVVMEDGKIIEEFSSLLNPQQKIPPFIEELTGINQEMVKEAPLFSEIAPKVASLLDDAYFVAHNVLFDLSFLQDELIEAGFEGFFGPVLDTVELARILFPTADSYKLSDLAQQEGIVHERPHQADSDAAVTAELLQILINKMHTLPRSTLRQLANLAVGLKSDIHQLLEDLLTNASQSIEEVSHHVEIHRGIALKKAEQVQESDSIVNPPFPLTEKEIEGLLKKVFPAFERRVGQYKMMDAISQAFLTNEHAMIEAGTGIGKSLAYLIPSLLFAKQTNQPVIISTYTTQLQQQLVSKEIAYLRTMFPFPISISLLKGRGHYISLSRFSLSLSEVDDNYDTTLSKMQILVWLTESVTGDIDELNLSSGGMLFWNKIKNDHTHFHQDTYWQNYDFYSKAKRNAHQADLVITNHALLLTDLISDQMLLPDYQYVVIDEGHHFEKAAGKYFGKRLDYLSVRLLLGQMGLLENKQLYSQMEGLLAKGKKQDPTLLIDDRSQLIAELFFCMDEFFRMVVIFTKHKVKSKSYSRVSYRLKREESGKEWTALVAATERFFFVLKDTRAFIEGRISLIKQTFPTLSREQLALLEELTTFLLGISELIEGIKTLFLSPANGDIRWLEMDVRSTQNSTCLYSQPIDIADYLRQQFFQQKKSVVITSATLTVKNSFQYMMNELGVTPETCRTVMIPSPFEYDQQVKLFVPDDLPEINAVSLEDYVVAITEHIISIAEATKGRMLILFTSYDMLKKTYDLIKESGLLDDYVLIGQGITSGSRTRLTRNFQRFEKAILLGTSSFWEGVDIPGEDLSCLIIVRLPFSPPDEPITEAKSEILKNENKNPFSHYSLPEAIIRFKQGFGRLIRTSSDRGVIVVFDRRIVTTKYGKAFLESIPSVPLLITQLDDMVDSINEWL